MHPVYLILHNIRSAHNVGSLLRTADAAGVQKVYLCGCTPLPIDRFGRKRKDVAKVSLGAEDSVSWEGCTDTLTCIKTLRNSGVSMVAVEQDVRSVPHTSFFVQAPTAFVLGEERYGLTKDILALCDSVVEIPMRGKKESLNVSVAAGIVLFRCTEKFS